MLLRIKMWLASLAVRLKGNTLTVVPTVDSFDIVKQQLTTGRAILLDVREQREWDAGHLAQARLLPFSQFQRAAGDRVLQAQLASEVPQDKIVYCHCVAGVRALIAGNLLKDLGYDVRPIEAGYRALVKAGFSPAN